MLDFKPTVMCFSGMDPTGGAGIQADIETLFSVGCHAVPIVTALTAQNTRNAFSITSTSAALIAQQARAVLEDMPVQCFKIGLVSAMETVEVIHTILKDYENIPVVLDPVVAAGGGYQFSDAEALNAIRSLLIPLTTVLTPNTDEIKQLAPAAASLDACADELIEAGCQHVLLTGTHAKTDGVVNRLYTSHRKATLYNWPRLPDSYHGSGCTLAAAIAGYLAHKLTLRDAIQQAQRFTWEALNHGISMGRGQRIPNRSYWNKQQP